MRSRNGRERVSENEGTAMAKRQKKKRSDKNLIIILGTAAALMGAFFLYITV